MKSANSALERNDSSFFSPAFTVWFSPSMIEGFSLATTVSSKLTGFVPFSSRKRSWSTVHSQYSMFPFSATLAALASTLSSVCPLALITVSARLISFVHSSSLKILLHLLHVQYAMFPFSVHVASLASVLTRVCFANSPYSSPHVVQTALCVHVAVPPACSFWIVICFLTVNPYPSAVIIPAVTSNSFSASR